MSWGQGWQGPKAGQQVCGAGLAHGAEVAGRQSGGEKQQR